MSTRTDILEIEINARNKAASVVKGFRQSVTGAADETVRSTSRMEKGFHTLWKKMLAGISVVALFTQITGATIGFERSFANVTTLIPKGTYNVQLLEKELLSLPPTLGDIQQLTESAYDAISGGVGPAESVKFVGEAAKFAKANIVQFGSATDIVTTIMNTYGRKAGDVTAITDQLTTAIRLGKMRGEEMAMSYGQVAGTANTVGISFTDLNAAIVTLTAGGVRTRMAMTALKAIIANIAKPTTDAEKAAAGMAGGFSLASLKSQGLSQFLQNLVNHVKGNTQAQTDLFGSVEAFNAIAVLTSDVGMKKFINAQQELTNSAGATVEAFEKQQSTFAAQFDAMKFALQRVAVETFLPLFKDIAKWLSENREQITEFVKVAVTGIRGVLTVVFELKDVLIAAGKVWVAYWAVNKLKPVFTVLQAGFLTASKTMLHLVDTFRLARTFGVNTFHSIKSVAIEAGHAIGKIPTVVKIGIAFVGLELLGGLIGQIEKLTGFKYRSTGEWTGSVALSLFIDVGSGMGAVASNNFLKPMMENAEKMIKTINASIQSEFKLTADELDRLKESFDIKPSTMHADDLRKWGNELRQAAGFWGEVKEKATLSTWAVEEFYKTVKEKELDFTKDREEINQLVVELERLSSTRPQVYAFFNDLGNLGGILKSKIISGMTAINGMIQKTEELNRSIEEQTIISYKQKKEFEDLKGKISSYTTSELAFFIEESKKNNKLSEDQVKILQELKKQYESLSSAAGLLTKEGLKSLNTESESLIRVIKGGMSVFESNSNALSKVRDMVDGVTKKYQTAGREVPPGIQKISKELSEMEIKQKAMAAAVSLALVPFVNLTGVVQNLTGVWIKTDAAQKEVNKQYDAFAAQVGILTRDSFKELNFKVEAANKLFNAHKDQIKGNMHETANLVTIYEDLISTYRAGGQEIPRELQENYEKTLQWRQEQQALLFTISLSLSPLANFSSILERIGLNIKENKNETTGLVQEFEALSQIGGQLTDALSKMGVIGEKTAGALGGITSGISGIGAGIDMWKKAEEAGSKFSQTLGKISGGVAVFSASMSIAISAVQLFISLLKEDWQGRANAMLAPISTATAEMKEQLAQLAEQLGSVNKAYNQLMGDFIASANIQTREQFSEWLREVHRLVATLANGEGSVQDLENAFNALITQGEQFGIFGREFDYLVDQIQAAGIELEALNQLIDQQLQKATGGLSDFIKISTDTQEGFNTAISMATNLFQAYIESGTSRLDAFRQMENIFNSLFESAQKSGYEMNAAFQELVNFQQRVKNNEELIQGVEGLNSLLEGLANSTIPMSQDAFDDFSTSAATTFDQLIAAGFSSEESLMLMAPVLENLRFLEEERKLTIDDTTRALIDQAEKQGILSEQTQSDSEIIIELLASIAEALGATLPEALRDLGNTAGDEVDQMIYKTGALEESWIGVQGQIKNTETAIGDLDVIYTDKMSGHSMIPETENLKKSLENVWDILEEIKKKVADVDDSWGNHTANIRDMVDRINQAIASFGGDWSEIDTQVIGLKASIDILADDLGILIPAELTTLKERWEYVWGTMASDTENMYLGPNGILQNLLGTLALIDGKIYEIGDTVKWYDQEYQIFTRNIDAATRQNAITSLEEMRQIIEQMGLEHGETIEGMQEKIIYYSDSLNNLADTLGIVIPDSLDSLQDRWNHVFSQMASDTENLYLGPDGVLRNIMDTLALIGQQTADQIGSNYGVYTEAEKQQMTIQFQQMGHLWDANRGTILSSEGNMRSFLRDLESLVVIDEAQAQYTQFLTSMRQWYAHLQRGETWDEVTDTWLQAAAGTHFIVPSDIPEMPIIVHPGERVDVWTPDETRKMQNTTTGSTDSSSSSGGNNNSGSSAGTGGDTFVFQQQFNSPTVDDFILEWIKAFKGNKHGIKNFVKIEAANARERFK